MGDLVLDRVALPVLTARRSRIPLLAAVLVALLAVNGLLWLSLGPSGPPGDAEARLWHRSHVRVLTATQPWERLDVQEPGVWWTDGRWHMIYTGGWASTALGYATSPSPGGPWTKHDGPVLGHGAGGWPGDAVHSAIYRQDGQLWVYFSSGQTPGTIGARDLHVATGPDAEHLHALTRPAMRHTASAVSIVNGSVVRQRGSYALLFDTRVKGRSTWEVGYATGPTPAGPFTIRAFPLRSLQRGGAYGGLDVHRVAGRWVAWFLASTASGSLPTDIYRAESRDLIHWHRVTRTPVLARQDAWEVDQVADPSVVRHGGETVMFFDGLNNPRRESSISYASTGLAMREILDRGHSRWEWLPFR